MIILFGSITIKSIYELKIWMNLYNQESRILYILVSHFEVWLSRMRYISEICRWSFIAGILSWRTSLAVKNHCNTIMRKKILHRHCHVVKPHCTRATQFSTSHHNENTKWLYNDSFLRREGKPHNYSTWDCRTRNQIDN